MVIDLQGKLDEIPTRNAVSSLMGSREDLLYQDEEFQDNNASASDSTSRERDIVCKGI